MRTSISTCMHHGRNRLLSYVGTRNDHKGFIFIPTTLVLCFGLQKLPGSKSKIFAVKRNCECPIFFFQTITPTNQIMVIRPQAEILLPTLISESKTNANYETMKNKAQVAFLEDPCNFDWKHIIATQARIFNFRGWSQFLFCGKSRPCISCLRPCLHKPCIWHDWGINDDLFWPWCASKPRS